MGGDWITSYLIQGSVGGIDMIECMVRIALGEKPSINGYYDSGSYVATRFLPASEGVLLGLDGLDAARSRAGSFMLSAMVLLASATRRPSMILLALFRLLRVVDLERKLLIIASEHLNLWK